ncbi:hypothetical protein JTB14_011487 [Gonioctena quinquepunctata]|nr:hypothetical protein JTB14_011487 [Gonioctena quinquepunctata]
MPPKWRLAHIPTGCKNIVICSDSLSVLTSIQNIYNPTAQLNPFVIRIKTSLYNMKISDRNFTFIWVKAHTGIEFNEKVDTLAKEVVNLTTLATTQICLDDLIAADKVVRSEKWLERWKNCCRNNPTRYTRIHSDIPSKHWHYDLILSRRCISVYNRLKFGHGCYPVFLARIGITNSNPCEDCNVEGDLDHIFFNCKNTRLEGQELYSNLLLLEPPTPINLLTLLALNENKTILCIFKFIQKTGPLCSNPHVCTFPWSSIVCLLK